MNCGYGEKIILYFYGEADAAFKASVESHLAGCAACRGELGALRAAGAWLSAGAHVPSAASLATVMRAARAAARRGARGFMYTWREAVLSGALAAVLAVVFAFSGRPAGPELAWNGGVDARLDSVEYSLLQAQSEPAFNSGDWEYNYSVLEDANQKAQESV